MTPQTVRRLFTSGGDSGGNGKSVSLLLVADWLKSKGLKRAYIDADQGNKGTARSFEHFLQGQPVTRVDIQDPEDLDRIFNMTAKSEVDVLVDLPAGASQNMKVWWELVDTSMFDEAGIQLITLIPVTPAPGSVENALEYLETVGPTGTFIICLNRMGYELSPKPKEILFQEWLSVQAPQEYDIRTIEIRHLDSFAMKALVAARCLPSQITGVEALVQKRVKMWAQKVHAQLDAIGLI